MNRFTLFLTIFFLFMVLCPSHIMAWESENIYSQPAAARQIEPLYRFILPITTPEYQSGSAMISLQAKNNFHQANNRLLSILLFASILFYGCCMIIWFFLNDRSVPIAFAYSSEISLRIGGHAPPSIRGSI